MNKFIYILIVLVIAVAIIFGFVWLIQKDAGPQDGKLDEFAKCIAQQEFTMYGAYWCNHCKAEKERFGSSFKFVPYVECTDNPNLCIEKDITGYPSWLTKDGVKYEGELGLERISEITGCKLPE